MEVPYTGTKDIDIYAETLVDLKMIITKLISKYTNIKHFFKQAKNDNSYIYKTADITVTIMNDNLGIIIFHDNSAVKVITIAKREMYLLNNIL
jgi:tripartite-type tricarboxylate transporter receptor subunit TctC